MIVAPPPLRPRVIHEVFTQLPCPRKSQTTVAMEGCAEKRIVGTDHPIDARVATAFGLISHLREQPLIFATCVADRDRAHLAGLASLLRDLRAHSDLG